MKCNLEQLEIGQSLIETVVAIFVLVMGISAALGLATYAFGTSTNVTKQIIGTGLAREGVEAVKNMRDTNWLKGTPSTNCYNFAKGDSTGTCYKYWLNASGGGVYNIHPGSTANNIAASQTYKLDIKKNALTTNENFWVLSTESANFALDRDAQAYANSPSSITSGKFYFPASGTSGTSDFFRRITISSDLSKQPYSNGNDSGTFYYWPKITVISDVWWKDKSCPTVSTWEQAKTSCRVRLQMDLTNWRVY